MKNYLVLGYGAVGKALVQQLLSHPDIAVTVVTRSGSGPRHKQCVTVACDVTDLDGFSTVVEDIQPAVVLCAVHTDYSTKGFQKLPRLEQGILDTALVHGIKVVFAESLYAFGAPDSVMTETSPYRGRDGKSRVRIELLRQRAMHRATTISVMAADFIGQDSSSLVNLLIAPRAAVGKTVWVIGSHRVLHSFTYVPDMARAMIAAARHADTLAAAGDCVVMAPTNPPVTQKRLADLIADAAGAPRPKVRAIGSSLLWALQPFGALGELARMRHQWTRDYVMDSSASDTCLGLSPTPLNMMIENVVDPYKPRRS